MKMTMEKLTPRQTKLLQILAGIPIVSTDQIADHVFHDHGSPNKRASEHLRDLELLRLIEGKRGEIAKPKVWRLSKYGRELMKVKRPPVPLTGFKIDHHLAIAGVFLELLKAGNMMLFMPELREQFSKNKIYSPDAFFVYNRRAYVLEIQLTPLSTNRWAAKWGNASEYFDGDHFLGGSFQVFEKKIRPSILVISSQKPDIIRAGSKLNITIIQSINELISPQS